MTEETASRTQKPTSRFEVITNPDDILSKLTPYHWVGGWMCGAEYGPLLTDMRYVERGVGRLLTEPRQTVNSLELTGGAFDSVQRAGLKLYVHTRQHVSDWTLFGHEDIRSSEGELTPRTNPSPGLLRLGEVRDSPMYRGELRNSSRKYPDAPPTHIWMQPAFYEGKCAVMGRMQDELVELFTDALYKGNSSLLPIDTSHEPLPPRTGKTFD